MVDSNWGYQVADTIQLAYLTRAGIIESRHHGLVCLTGPDGKLIQEHGNSRKLIYPRSAVKPLQALAMRRAGLNLSGAQLAMSSASHQGTPEHTAIVLSILADAGLTESDLMCPVAWPGNPTARAASASETRAAFNCSGKHAAFLATCVKNGWDTKTYLQPEHPLQKLIVEVIEEFSGEKIPLSTFDGCGAPLHLMSLQGLARAIGNLDRHPVAGGKSDDKHSLSTNLGKHSLFHHKSVRGPMIINYPRVGKHRVANLVFCFGEFADGSGQALQAH